MLSSNIKVRTETSLEQVRRIELPSQPWQGRILATEPHLHCINTISKRKKKSNKKFMLPIYSYLLNNQ